jgi:hypothetical protein
MKKQVVILGSSKSFVVMIKKKNFNLKIKSLYNIREHPAIISKTSYTV